MSFTTDPKLSSRTKPPTTLNPHAAAFVPSTLRSPSSSKLLAESSTTASRHSVDEEEEARQFWNHQLPDDITPDFTSMTQDDCSYDSGSFSLATLSLDDAEKFPCASPGRGRGGFVFSDQPLGNADRDRNPFGRNSRHSVGEMELDPVDYLASQFPGFAAESLAQVYYANGCDLHSTLEMLTQLELQVDGGGLNQKMSPKSFAAPNLTPMDFPALSQGDGLQQQKDNMMLFSKSVSQPGSIDYVSAVKKLASPDSGMWKYQPNDSADSSSIGSSRNSLPVAGAAYKSGSIYSDKLHNRAPTRPAPVWLETGDAVGNMYSNYREDARDYARLRNVYFEQARQAYLVGNKALAKDLSAKGQLHNLQMKAAHEKAQEAIYRQRNPVGEGGSERMIDLHGLHVSEALQVLKHELSVLRSKARATQERLQVYICVGTGHHTRGSRTPARLPVAVQRYLLEGEGLDYSEPQAGLLRVIIY